MSIDTGTLLAPEQPVRRDQWGRYVVVPPEGTKPVGYTRATTIAKALDDTTNLMAWGKRMTALGLASRPDLLALVQAASPDDRKELNRLCDSAVEAGGGTARRDLGTAIHKMVERSHADPTWQIPDQYAADIAAVNAALDLAGLEVIVEHSEQMVVLDRHQIAGTFDLLLRDRTTGTLYIGDLKTGSSVQYGSLGWAIQLGIYANADNLYQQGAAKDGSEDVREPMPNVDKTTAVIVHVEPGSGSCQLHDLDIARGAEALETAMAVRTWQKTKGLLTARTIPEPVAADPARREWVLARTVLICEVPARAARLTALWPDAVPSFKQARETGHTHTADELDRIVTALDRVEAEFEIPFGPPDPTLPGPEPVVDPEPAFGPVPALPDEGRTITPDELAALKALHDGCDDAARTAATRWAKQAGHAKVGFGTRGNPTERRAAISAAAIALAQWDGDDEAARTAIGIVLGEEVQPAVKVGAALGVLTIDEANRLTAVAAALTAGTPIEFTPAGVPTLAA